MKKIYFILFLSIWLDHANSQCQMMAERDFQMAKDRLMSNSRNINSYQNALDLARIYCLTSVQAREIAMFLANDRDKLDFLKTAYPQITDKDNFTDVMDVFRLYSMAFRLYHNTLGTGALLTNPNNPISQNPNCQRSMDPITYQSIMRQVSSSLADREKAATILNMSGQCLTTQQIMGVVSTIQDENIKLDVLKRLYLKVFDLNNYSQASTILSISLRPAFISYLQNPVMTNNDMTPNTSELDFNKFTQAVKSQNFDKDKEDYIKTYMKNVSLNTVQIKSLIKLLSFDASKVDIAKFLYDNCIDKQNYYSVSEVLQFSSSKTELNDFVKSR